MKHAIRFDGSKKYSPEQVIQSLDKPGAGIPLIARIMLRTVVKNLVIRSRSWVECEKQILSTHRKILRELENINLELLTTRALVPSQRGLEDSSRYWSIAMTLQHLIIVGAGLQTFIIELGQKIKPQQVADTALVKPEDQVYKLQIIDEYKNFTENLIQNLETNTGKKLSQLDTSLTHKHPWFGSMNAKDWFWLIGTHMGLHLQQIREIKKAIQLEQTP
jgi:hypothetical protein